MASKSQQDTPSVDVEELLDTVDSTLDRLKTLYEQYFLGIQKQAPAFIHSDVERKLRDLTQINIRNTGLRYRLATLQQKFGSYNSYWRRTLRQIENGTYARNLAKIGREAAKNGADIPEEILAAMPKRMREQVLRDRDQALALAKRRKQLEQAASEDGAADYEVLEDTAYDSEPEVTEATPIAAAPVVEKKTKTGAFVLDEDEPIDYNALFSAFDADDAPKAGVRNKIPTVQPATRPQPLRMPKPSEQPRATPAAGTPPPASTAKPAVGTSPPPSASAKPAEPAKSAATVDAMINSIPRPVAQQPSGPTSSGVPRAIGQQPSQPTSSGVPRPVAKQPSEPTSSGVPRPVGQQPSQPTATPPGGARLARVTPVQVAVPRSQDPTRQTGPVPRISDPSRQTGPVPAIDPSRQTGPMQAGDPSRQTGPVQRVDPSRQTGPTPAIPRPATGQVHTIPRPAPSQQSRPIPVIPGSAQQTGPVPVESMNGPFPRTPASEKSGPTPTTQRQTGSVPVPTTQRQTASVPVPTTQRQSGSVPVPTTQRQTGPIAKPTPSSTPKPPLKPPPGMSEADVNALHAKYVQAKQAIGEKVDAGSRDKLLKTINQTAPKIMEQYKASSVDFSVVVKDNQVIIKAKPKT
ncbi:MAG TPA: MXAN_5187 C-terminal domain-containing protein [Kofleriaceae bacterium]|nr:MXAN_5187 C-terminal domain-containing protein [Kofleriaceae bacterium]